MLSIFNPVFFYQFLAMHHPHSAQADFHHPLEDSLPVAIKYFVRAVKLAPHTWESRAAVRDLLSAEAHKAHFVETVCYYVCSLHDVRRLAELHVIDANVQDIFANHTASLHPLSPQQHAIYSALLAAVRQRRQDQSTTRGSSVLLRAGKSSRQGYEQQTSSSSMVIQEDNLVSNSQSDNNSTVNWRVIRVILGKVGTGKSQVLIRLLHECHTQDMRCVVVAPVALLANHYHQVLADRIEANTLHSIFRIPVGEDNNHAINFSLAQYDLIVLDEASMVSRTTFDKMASMLCALPKRPVLVIAGDRVQQQPLQTSQGRVVQVTSILNDGTLRDNSITYILYRQFRCVDSAYGAFLDHIRYWKPQQQFLDSLQDGRVIETTEPPTNTSLWNAITDLPNSTVLTVSKRGADRVNQVVVERLFARVTTITNAPCQGRLCSFLCIKECVF